MAQTIYQATPRKLSKGDWGVAIQEPIPQGSVVGCVVSAKNGKTWEGSYSVIWTGRDYCLAAEVDSAEKYETRNAAAEPKDDNYYVSTVFQATQTQLKNGDWGAKIQESIPKGTIVRCRFDDTPALVDPPQYRVIWSNDEFSVAADYDPYYGMDSKNPTKRALNQMRRR